MWTDSGGFGLPLWLTAGCVAQDVTGWGPKPECPLDSASLGSRVHSLSRIGIMDRRRRIGLTFWVRDSGGLIADFRLQHFDSSN